MFGKFLKSKIHRAVVTGADINYQGSITIDTELMRHADLQPFEFVDIWDVTSGARLETYVIEDEIKSGIEVVFVKEYSDVFKVLLG